MMEKTLILNNGEVVEADPETESWVRDKDPVPVSEDLLVKVTHEGERDALMDRAVGFENQVRSGHEAPFGLRFDASAKEIRLVQNFGNKAFLQYPEHYQQIFGWLDYHRPEAKESITLYKVTQEYIKQREERDDWLSTPAARKQAKKVFRSFDNPDIQRDFAGWLLGHLHDWNQRVESVSEEAPETLGDITRNVDDLKGMLDFITTGGSIGD